MSQNQVTEFHLPGDFTVGVSVTLKIDQEMNSATATFDHVGQLAVQPDPILGKLRPGLGQQVSDMLHRRLGIIRELATINQEHAFVEILSHKRDSSAQETDVRKAQLTGKHTNHPLYRLWRDLQR